MSDKTWTYSHFQCIGCANSLPLPYLFTVGGQGYSSNCRRHAHGSQKHRFHNIRFSTKCIPHIHDDVKVNLMPRLMQQSKATTSSSSPQSTTANVLVYLKSQQKDVGIQIHLIQENTGIWYVLSVINRPQSNRGSLQYPQNPTSNAWTLPAQNGLLVNTVEHLAAKESDISVRN